MGKFDLTVRAEELGDELRRLREADGFTLELAGELINASASKMSRIENGLREGSTEDVAGLLAVYGCFGPRRDELLELAHEVDRRGWWQRKKRNFAERQRTLINLEAKADLITYFQLATVPGHLQTGEYTRAMMLESGMVSAEEAERRMITRMQRHAVLDRADPPRLLAIISELVLHQTIGGMDVMRRQLDYLATAARERHIRLHIVPKTRAYAGITGGFELLQREAGHKVVFLEHLESSLFLEEPDEIKTYETVVRLLLKQSLDAEDSIRVITARARELGSTE